MQTNFSGMRHGTKRFLQTARVAVLLLAVLRPSAVEAQRVMDVSGSWDFAMGETPVYNDYVMLPGSMLTNEKGLPVSTKTPWTGSLYDSSYYFNPYMAKYRTEGQMKFPFFLTPSRHYVGTAWYRRKVYVSDDWKDKQVTLLLERPHIETTVYVNGHKVGSCQSLSVPHRFDVTKYLEFGQQNEIAIRVYNGIENVGVGQDSHSVTDQTQGNWNGIAGRIELHASWKKLSVKGVRLMPDSLKLLNGTSKKLLNMEVLLDNHIPAVRLFPMWTYNVTATIREYQSGKPGKVVTSQTAEAVGSKVAFSFLASMFTLWDEFKPALYHLTIEAGEDKYELTFGLRYVSTKGRQLYINDHPLYLRGTVESCCFPETGFPPTSEEQWTAIFGKCKEYGLNHVRFHSYCPPDAAFAAADRVGIYLQVEGPSWPNHGVKLRRGQIIDKYLLEESKRIIDEYGHHPSFIMMAAGNEPAGDWVSYCNDWVAAMRRYDPSKIYCGASVGGGWAWDDGSEYHVKGGARGLDWDKSAPQSADDYYAQIEFPRNYKNQQPNQSPIVAHEQGQWCSFPDLKETGDYTGAYQARNFEIFADLLRDNGMGSMAEKFLMASGKLQTLCYKYEIERNLRTPDYAGFQLLGLNDYSGQGTALVGPLNVHWREKGYTTALEWREFCSPVVALARFPQFVFTRGDTLSIPIQAYNAFRGILSNVTPNYFIVDSNSQQIIACGKLPTCQLPIGKSQLLGTITQPLDTIKAPAKLKLIVQLSAMMQNSWEFWVYPSSGEFRVESGEFRVESEKFANAIPSPTPSPSSAPEGTAAANSPLSTLHSQLPPTGTAVANSQLSTLHSQLYETATFDQRAIDVLEQGGTVLLTAAGRVTLGSDVKQTYLPVFWNTSWFKMRPPHTTGAYIDSKHPLFSHGFPTDSWANLNWWELLNCAQVMNLMELPASYQPPIQPIDTWHISRKLGMLIEARVLNGRLLMTTMDISSQLDQRHVARQMRHAIVSYMQSDDFQPQLVLSPDTISHFFTRQAPPVNMFTNDSPDELKPKLN